MLTELRAIAGCGRPWAADRAAFMLEITEQYNAGGINRPEYEELCRDLIRMDRLDSEADDIELKTALISAIYVVAQLS